LADLAVFFLRCCRVFINEFFVIGYDVFLVLFGFCIFFGEEFLDARIRDFYKVLKAPRFCCVKIEGNLQQKRVMSFMGFSNP
jgi:hypothetical protein